MIIVLLSVNVSKAHVLLMTFWSYGQTLRRVILICQILSIALSIGIVILLAFVYDKGLRSMSWFSTPWLVFVGASNGHLAIYELRQNKCQMIPAHKKPITALAFSPDGKFLVSYSCVENGLSFWQTSTDTPLLYKAVPSWFIRVEQMQSSLLKSNKQTYWVPDFVKEKRFGNYLKL